MLLNNFHVQFPFTIPHSQDEILENLLGAEWNPISIQALVSCTKGKIIFMKLLPRKIVFGVLLYILKAPIVLGSRPIGSIYM